MPAFYDTDLAAAHAAGFSGPSLAGGTLVLDSLRHAGLRAGTIVDLGCGAGEWARLAAGHGFDAVGVDVSEAMLALARPHGSPARFVMSSLWDFALPAPVVAVTAFGEALNYGTPALPSVADLTALVGRVATALAGGGLFVFDLLVSGEPMHYRSWRDDGDRSILVEVSEDPDNATLTRSIVLFTREGHSYRRSDEEHAVRVYHQPDVERALHNAGLSWTTSAGYGDVALGPRRAAFLARPAAWNT